MYLDPEEQEYYERDIGEIAEELRLGSDEEIGIRIERLFEFLGQDLRSDFYSIKEDFYGENGELKNIEISREREEKLADLAAKNLKGNDSENKSEIA